MSSSFVHSTAEAFPAGSLASTFAAKRIAHRRPRVLMVATLCRLPYRVMRCASAMRADVYVLGADYAKHLAKSRYCVRYIPTGATIDGAPSEALARDINDAVKRYGIDLVMAGDAPSTRGLIAIRDLVEGICFPAPIEEQFDLLNNKWRFGEICESLGIRFPRTYVIEQREGLETKVRALGLGFPLMAKPLSMDGSNGVIRIDERTASEQLANIDYEPILIQPFIPGDDIGASVYCLEGQIHGFVAHTFREGEYITFYDRYIFESIEKIVRFTKATGVLNFDMRLAPGGDIWFLECNPRFYFKMAMTMMAGLNFVGLGVKRWGPDSAPEICASGRVRLEVPNARPLLKGMLTPWKLKLISWSALKFMLSDPIYVARERYVLEPDPVVDLSPKCGGTAHG